MRSKFKKQHLLLSIMIEYHGPRQMRRNIEIFVQENMPPHIARTGVAHLYVGKVAGISMKPIPHFIFDEIENEKVEEAFRKYWKAEDSEKERVYQEARAVCLAASPLPEGLG